MVTREKITNRLYFVVLPLILLLSIVTLVYAANNSHQSRETNKQLAVVNTNLKKQVQSSEDIVKEQDKHLQCILAFFGATDRANSRISNFDPCTIVHNTTGQSEVLPLVPNKSTVQPNSPAETQVQMRPTIIQSVTPTPNPSPTGSPIPVATLPNCTVDVLFIHIGC